MGSGAIIGAAAGCGFSLLLMLAFIIFRYKAKRNEASCCGGFLSQQKHEFGIKNGRQPDKSPTSSCAVSSITGASNACAKSGLLLPKLSPIQPDVPSCSTGFNCESPYLSQTLFPSDYHRKLSSSTGYSSHSTDTCRSDIAHLTISLHYRCYYDLDNGQLILHIVEARLSPDPSQQIVENEGLQLPSPERNKQAASNRDTYVMFYLSDVSGERRCGQTKVTRTSAGMANYDEIFTFPASYETVTEQRLHFDVLCYNSYSRPQSLGSAEVMLDDNSLQNQDMWTDMSGPSYSPQTETSRFPRENHNGQSEILVFLSFSIPREELTVNILKAKNIAGLFPIYGQDESEVYVKTCLIADGAKIKRRSAGQAFAHPSNATLVFNESLTYPIKYPQLEMCVLLLYIVHRRKEPKKEKTVGKCVIGPFGGASSAGYLQWQSSGNSQIIRSNAVWHTIVRYHCSEASGI